jgi:L-asparaginase
MSVRILVTGGTFDKSYDEIQGQLVFRQSNVAEMLKLGRCSVPVQVTTLMMVDSLHMTDSDRQVILNYCRNCAENKIIITHGTDTMEITARSLGEAQFSKTIVLTGAMIPYTFGSSDGFFNLGSALAFVQSLQPDVYVAMNGRCFHWQNVTKNKSTGVFEELNS